MIKIALKNIITYIITWEAKKVLKKYQPQVIVIGGDVGKTTTKDAIFQVISQRHNTWKSPKSMNSETGVPLSIMGKKTGWNSIKLWLGIIKHGFSLILQDFDYPKVLVLEVGDRKPGDTEKLLKWLKPDTVALCHIDEIPTHVEFFDSITGSNEEKIPLITNIKKTGGLVWCSDNLTATTLVNTHHNKNTQLMSFTTSDEVDKVIYNLRQLPVFVDNELGIQVQFTHKEKNHSVFIKGILGDGVAKAIASAVLVGVRFNIPVEEAITALKNFNQDLPKGRMRVINGIKNTIIIDDTYNAGYASTKLALETLYSLPGAGRKVAILGDMLELGEYTKSTHQMIGDLINKPCDLLVTVGENSKLIAETAKQNGFNKQNIFTFSNSKEAGKFVVQMIKEGDMVIVKGSQGIRMEKVVQELMLHPEERNNLLVRQEPEWQNR